MKKQLNSYAVPARRALLGTLTVAALTATSWAQWSTDSFYPTVVGSGWNALAGDVRFNADGTATFAVADTNTTGAPTVRVLKMYPDGRQEELSSDISPDPLGAKKIKLLNAETSDMDADILVQFSPSELDDYGTGRATYRAQLKNGALFEDYYSSYNRFVAAFQQDNVLRILTTDLIDNDMKVYADDDSDSSYVNRVDESVKDFHIGLNGTDSLYYTFTAYRAGEHTPSQVYIGQMGSLVANDLYSPNLVEFQDGESQSKSLWTSLQGTGSSMITWIGNYRGIHTLYSKVYDDVDELVGVTPLLDDVVSYDVTPTTYEIPVIAAIQRDETVYPPVDTLVAGLLGPVDGVALTLPFATGFQMEVKDIRQEANGDFSIVYSAMENGTNLLKVLRVSGLTASTLWNTTVADLGAGSPELIEHFPNVSVDADPAGNLYIAARYDLGYSQYSEWQAVRVRADGQLGADPLVAPANLTVVSSLGNYVEIEWTDMTNSESIYLVARTDWDFSGLKIFNPREPDTTLQADPTAQPYTTYHYYVGVYNQYTGQLEVSGPLTVTTGAPAS